MKIALLLLAFLAAALAQSVSFSDLSFDSRTLGTLLPTTSDNDYELKLYRVWVPENVSLVRVTFDNLDTSACSYLYVYVRTGGFPCGDTTYASQSGVACHYDSWSLIDGCGSSTCEEIIDQKIYSGDGFRWVTNDWWYFGVGRYYSSDYDQTCNYQLQVSVNDTCGNGTIATYFDQTNEDICLGYDTAATLPWSKNTVYPPDANNYIHAGVRYIPKDLTGKITVTLVANETFDIYGTPQAGATDQSSNYYTTRNFCESPTYEYNSTTQIYVYTTECWAPRPGSYFYIGWNSDYEPSDYVFVNVTITETVCSGSTLGPNCEFPLLPINSTNVGPYRLNGTNDYDYYHFWMDFPGNNTGSTYFNFTVSSEGTGYGYILWRRLTFQQYNSESNDNTYTYYRSLSSGVTWAGVIGEDVYQGGRWFFSVVATSGVFNFTISSVAPVTTTTTTGGTTANPTTTTGTSTTTPTTTAPPTTTAQPTSTTAPTTTAPATSTTARPTTGIVTTGNGTLATGTSTTNGTTTEDVLTGTTTDGASSLVASLFLLVLAAAALF